MATATAKLKQPIVQPLESITLTLNEDEVRTLMAIFSRIGGSQTNSARKHVESIGRALDDALSSVGIGLGHSHVKVDESVIRSGLIYFEDF